MLTQSVVSLILWLKENGHINNLESVVDLGAQELWLPNIELIRKFVFTFSGKELLESELEDLTKGEARQIFNAIECKYLCLDVAIPNNEKYENVERLQFDLNFDSVREEDKKQYDLLLNIGVTEHIIDQLNCFECCHDLVKTGGYMLHYVPFLGFNNGFYFNYQPVFFEELAEPNGYSIAGMWMQLEDNWDTWIPWDEQVFRQMKRVVSEHNDYVFIIVLFRKNIDCEFNLPFQAFYRGIRSKEMSQRYKMVVNGEVKIDYPPKPWSGSKVAG